jgi:diguanylate cyclase (GGDEF)-like protein
MTTDAKNKADFTESDSLNLIEYVSKQLTDNNTKSAVQQIIKHIRIIFSLPCVSIREITPEPYSLKFVYESIEDLSKQRIGEVITFSPENWNYTYRTFKELGYYRAIQSEDKESHDIVGDSPNHARCILHIPMFSGDEFLGTLDLVDFDRIHNWSSCAINSLKVCASMLSQHLYMLNSFFMSSTSCSDYDPVTGLISASLFSKRVKSELPALLKISPVAIIYTDIHHFKFINETYGYQKGDELLQLTAAAMTNNAPDSAPELLFARVHSDNFVCVAPVSKEQIDTFDSYIYSENQKVSDILRRVCPDVRIRLNSGIYFVLDPETDSSTAISNANLARKIAKNSNSRRPLVFNDSMMEDIKYQEYLNNELPKAIENHYLKVYYQPKINCSNDSLYGAEALVRWQLPDGSFIYPDRFIPQFEKNGNIIEVDFYVYREVFRYLRGRIDQNLPVVPISMNVSRVHFRANTIIPYIKSLLEEYRVPPELLEFELTENIYIKNFNKANEFIKTCRELGIKVSMDDFGSGYSSLNVMSTLPIDTLKIDRVFLKNDNLSKSDKTVLQCMISMAKQLGMNVICEGVETQSQSAFLKEVNCDVIQGYYYGKPMDEESFNEFTMNHMNK